MWWQRELMTWPIGAIWRDLELYAMLFENCRTIAIIIGLEKKRHSGLALTNSRINDCVMVHKNCTMTHHGHNNSQWNISY